MQCSFTFLFYSDILELYYGGEALANVEQPQAYTCPYCSRMGFTDTTLQEHVVTDHVDTTFEVVSIIHFYQSFMPDTFNC